jgi:hypothetical protein
MRKIARTQGASASRHHDAAGADEHPEIGTPARPDRQQIAVADAGQPSD